MTLLNLDKNEESANGTFLIIYDFSFMKIYASIPITFLVVFLLHINGL